MRTSFIPIKSLDGVLLYSQKKKDLSLSITTEEMVVQKPNLTIYFKFEDVLEFSTYHQKSQIVSFISPSLSGYEVTNSHTSGDLYCIKVKKAVFHTRSGIFEKGAADIIVPINGKIRDLVTFYSENIAGFFH